MRKDLLKKRAKLDMETDPVSSDEEIRANGDNENDDPLLAADPFDSLMGSNNEASTTKKSNGVGKKVPSPVKDILTSDDEKNDEDDSKSNEELDTSKASKGKDKDDDNADEKDDDAEEEGYEVEDIVGHKWIEGEKYYRIRWKNFGKKDDTWQLEADLSWYVVNTIIFRLKC